MSSILLNEKEIARAISRISHEILERNKGAENIALIGIRTRGVTVSTRLKQKINDIENLDVAVGALDITLYRDDVGTGLQKPQLKKNFLFLVNSLTAALEVEPDSLSDIKQLMRTSHGAVSFSLEVLSGHNLSTAANLLTKKCHIKDLFRFYISYMDGLKKDYLKQFKNFKMM